MAASSSDRATLCSVDATDMQHSGASDALKAAMQTAGLLDQLCKLAFFSAPALLHPAQGRPGRCLVSNSPLQHLLAPSACHLHDWASVFWLDLGAPTPGCFCPGRKHEGHNERHMCPWPSISAR